MSERTASKWGARYRSEGEAGLADRPSAPRTVANRTDERRMHRYGDSKLPPSGSAAVLCGAGRLATPNSGA